MFNSGRCTSERDTGLGLHARELLRCPHAHLWLTAISRDVMLRLAQLPIQYFDSCPLGVAIGCASPPMAAPPSLLHAEA